VTEKLKTLLDKLWVVRNKGILEKELKIDFLKLLEIKVQGALW
jgi:hypothetical protein